MVIEGTPVPSSPGATEGLSFAAGYKRISDHLYATFSPDATEATVCKRLYNDGYRGVLGGNYIDLQTRQWHHHDWSFLSPAATLVAFASVAADAAVTIASAVYSTVTTITVTGGTPFSAGMIGHTFHAVSADTDWTILSVTSNVIITVSGDASALHATADTFTINSERYAMLPATFGGMVDPFTYGSDTTRYYLEERSVRDITRLWSGSGTVTNDPWLYAIRPSAFSTATGQRSEVVWNTYPASDKTLRYRYRVLWSELTNDATYPLGGIDINEAIIYAGLKQHEERQGGGGDFARRAEEEMTKAVRLDQSRLPRKLGMAGYSGSKNVGIVYPVPATRYTYGT